jgi:hypothetical protein
MRTKYTAPSATLLATALLTLAAACGDRGSQQGSGTPAREIQLAPAAAAQPQLNDTPVQTAKPAPPKTAPKTAQVAKAPEKPAESPPQVVVRPLTSQDNPAAAQPAAPAPAAAPASSAPATGIVAAGTTLAVKPLSRVCTNTFKAGDRFTTTLSESVAGTNGTVIPAGSSVVLKVDESARSENSKDSVKLSFSAVSLRVGEQSYELTGHVLQTAPLEKVRAQSTGDQAKKVGAGAAIGAIAGQLLGKNTRSTVIGGAVGAAAGAAVAAGTADYDGCVPTTSVLNVSLDVPLRVKTLPD